jgi:hypothetical protein
MEETRIAEQLLYENLKDRDHLGDLDTDGRTMVIIW